MHRLKELTLHILALPLANCVPLDASIAFSRSQVEETYTMLEAKGSPCLLRGEWVHVKPK